MVTNEILQVHSNNTERELLPATREFLEKKTKTPRISFLNEVFDKCKATANTCNPRSMVLSGVAGVGKSQTIKRYVNKYPRFKEGYQIIVPVLSLDVPKKATVVTLTAEIFRALTGAKVVTGRTDNLAKQIYGKLRKARVKLIIFDESQHLLRGNGTITQDNVDALKEIINELQIPIVLVGMPKTIELLKVKGKFEEEQQLKSRCRKNHILAPYSNEDLGWFQILKFYQGILNCELDLVGMSDALYLATDGLFRNLSSLFLEAIEIAGSTETIDIECLVKAYDEYRTENPLTFNPFELSAKQLDGEIISYYGSKESECTN
ncbi:TniB family NTP-binding protein [Pseudocolwellia agarivorans]|uniref:TniB family NTP-binding protein n=1 Tax=Pseudocolwellia agarivorans TaxID=1911682 RepID=UPI000987D49B|nr:TniB family NTP-binding protein [Pseudocolwellia agarivorans]